MKAMVLAAGLGTRLLPLTEDRPKALVEISGRSLLEIVLSRLKFFGIRDVVLNAHHFAGSILKHLEAHSDFGMRLKVSVEAVLLDTGGGLKKAAPFFTDDVAAGRPLVLHNVDVISTFDLRRMAEFHAGHDALATLAVQRRPSSRPLVFDAGLRLQGRTAPGPADVEADRETKVMAFSGIHVISARLLPLLSEEGAFSIIDAYIRLAAAGEKIIAFDASEYYWRDLGTPENLRRAEEERAIWLPHPE